MNKNVKILIKDIDRTKDISNWNESSDKINITFLNGKTYSYKKDNIQIEHSALSNNTVLSRFNYLKEVAKVVGLSDENFGNTLLNQYEKINFLSKDSILSNFLSATLKKEKTQYQSSVPPTIIYPFGFNLSQKTAVDNAFKNSLTVIEGPPGTGKTQTILNIIANAVVNKETVAIVSSNNSATANIYEKLKKYNVDFISAQLGSSDNKKKFIESQIYLPNLSNWAITQEHEEKIRQSLQVLSNTLNNMLSNKNKLSKIQQELDSLETEYKHFSISCNNSSKITFKYLKPISSNISLELWLKCEQYIKQNQSPNFFNRFINKFFKGVIDKSFYALSPEIMINICQENYYTLKIKELSSIVAKIKLELDSFDFNNKMNEYSGLSMKLFHYELTKKYKDIEDKKFIIEDLNNTSKEFLNRYPVILSTTYSLRNSLSNDIMYDYVIIDEASQVDLATGSLAFSCAKKAVIVGDLKQLPNVIKPEIEETTDRIFKNYNFSESYRYKSNNILSSILTVFKDIPRVLLKEHYRCHPQIIDFCNKKFYNNELIILSTSKSHRKPLILYKTTSGNHARKRVNQRQIDVIQNEIIPQQELTKNISLGIVTPYRDQTTALQERFSKTEIQVDTVDKFQGRENDVIILSTVDNNISKFTDNPNRLNVAVSRAINQLIVVINGNEETKDSNIKDLVSYIKYNNLEIIQSELCSVFDYLYKGYRSKREEFLKKTKKISIYDSENLMYTLICDVLKENKFIKFDVIAHVSLRAILKNTDKLDKDEKKYAENMLTHIDFLIFDKLGKIPCLAIEVDGFYYHSDNTAQVKRDNLKNKILEKYNLPLIRFKTNGSNEREQLISKLNEIISS